MEPEETTTPAAATNACTICKHEHDGGQACTHEGCTCEG